MKAPLTIAVSLVALLAPSAQAQVTGSIPSGSEAAEVADRLVQSRAVEAMIWGMPAVNFQLMYEAMAREVGGKFNEIVYWSGLPDWKNQTLTPNPDAIYLMPFIDTREAGPVVIEVPPAEGGSITGTIMDSWQTPLADVGPAGTDAGKGGKYLVLPPDYTGAAPEGYIPLPAATHRGYALLRSILESGSEADIAKAVEYGKRIKVYPLSQAEAPPATAYRDALGVLYDATIPYDVRFFEALARFVEGERWIDRDRAMIDQLGSIGIVAGERFAPSETTTALLNAAALDARALLEASYETSFAPYFADARWRLPVPQAYLKAVQQNYAALDQYPVAGRGLVFTYAFFTPKKSGTGSFYLMTIKDNAGAELKGSGTYRLTVPANVPVSQFWSATAYDRKTHALLRDQERVSRSSQNVGLKANADGSVDIYFGPTAPAGKEANWVPTDPAGSFEVLFRFYGPQPALLDKSWALPDIEPLG